MTTADHDKWLQKNSFYCQRLAAKVSRAGCDSYRANNQSRQVKAGQTYDGPMITLPGCCQSCPQAKGELLPAPDNKKNNSALFVNRFSNRPEGC